MLGPRMAGKLREWAKREPFRRNHRATTECYLMVLALCLASGMPVCERNGYARTEGIEDRMNDIYQFLCVYRPATLAFGMSVTEVRKRLASLSAIAA